MHELRLESSSDSFTRSPDDEAGSGLLGHSTSPHKRHRRQLSLSSFPARRLVAYTLYAGALIACALVIIWLHRGAARATETQIPKEVPGARIPLGQSVRNSDNREIFWWEQFPRLTGYFQGRRNLVTLSHYIPEQNRNESEPTESSTPLLTPVRAQVDFDGEKCYADEEDTLEIPQWSAYKGLPQRMPAPLMGSHNEIGLDSARCYDRIERLAIYGDQPADHEAGIAVAEGGDNDPLPDRRPNWKRAKWGPAQDKCYERNREKVVGREAFIVRTWSNYTYTAYDIAVLRAIISEVGLASRGKYTVHFLVHVQDEGIPIWASEDEYNRVLEASLPREFHGMATLWSVAQMRLIYPPPFPESIVNFSGGEVYEAYRSLHFPLQYFAEKHPEFDYFWQWEMDIRVTGHYHELLEAVSAWAERQPRAYAWERSAKFFIPSLFDNSYAKFAESVKNEVGETGHGPISAPQRELSELFRIPEQANPVHADHITDLITFNPLFDPSQTQWAFRDDITGYQGNRPPTRAALITASRMSRRLLKLMHHETWGKKHTMFPEMFPASIALHYGLKAIYAPLPVYFDHDWPSVHANEIFNNAKVGAAAQAAGMDHGDGYFHGGKGGSVFGPGEHVFRGSTYYSNAAFASYLWNRWLGHEDPHSEVEGDKETGEGGGGRMCLPMMVLHPIKSDE
ncbi:uncharacterized protein HMPREF1541_07229 [Cyphellophora europaea CBS 101466]|uniref:Glycosyl transferase CAP10 domain-containing protein n=1 Tax=Cyphellophora europaea (strain CBS 101466) TaxID=1220924 RepID=W2RM98_CYPE1|nr:uncharacterized protein HMPREF1541_07229 [Cyphellophora europaea CBS 101466]ETN37607.1 hypothetical protein HMPREF1541_07229 [Cyphellophora europaea CBS 101466]